MTEIQKYSDLKKALTSKFNLFVSLLFVLTLLDYLAGYPTGLKLVNAWFEFRGLTGSAQYFAIFGTFNNVPDYTARLEQVFMGLCLIVVLFSLSSAWISGLRTRTR